MNNILMLMRREVWENRSLWIAPLAIAGVIILIAAFGGVHYSDSGNFWFGTSASDIDDLPAAERERIMASMTPNPAMQRVIISGVLAGLVTVQLVALGVVVFFYLLDCLLAERRDRSILFWKSLPISDGQVVSSKALTALVAAPAFVLVVNALMLLVFSAVVAIRTHDMPFTPWSGQIYLQLQGVLLAFVPMVVIWYLPLAGYLLVISVWVRKNAFLWAVLPPAGVLLIEAAITHTSYLPRFLGARFAGFVEHMHLERSRSFGPDDFFEKSFTYVGRVFADWHIWVSALAGLALIYLAIRIRRFRDDS